MEPLELRTAAEWTTRYINSLPNASFAVVEGDYLSGKTSDKRCRHLPFKDAEGNVDEAHYQNARARMNQILPVSGPETAEELRRTAKATLDKYQKKHEAPSKQGGVDMDEVERLKAEVAAAQKRIAELEATLEKMTEAESQKAIAEKVTQITQLTEQVATLRTSIEGLEAQNAELEAQVVTRDADNAAKQAVIDQFERDRLARVKAERTEVIQSLKITASALLLGKAVEWAMTLSDEEWQRYIVEVKAELEKAATGKSDEHVSASHQASGVGKLQSAAQDTPESPLRELRTHLQGRQYLTKAS